MPCSIAFSTAKSYFLDSQIAFNIIQLLANRHIAFDICQAIAHHARKGIKHFLRGIIFLQRHKTRDRIEETNFPPAKMWKIILSALFVPAVLYLIVVIAIGGYVSLVIYCILGMLMYAIMGQYRKKDPDEHALVTLTPEDIDKGY